MHIIHLIHLHSVYSNTGPYKSYKSLLYKIFFPEFTGGISSAGDDRERSIWTVRENYLQENKKVTFKTHKWRRIYVVTLSK